MAGDNGGTKSEPPAEVIGTASKIFKLLFILACYTSLFVTVVKQARWFLYNWSSDAMELDVLDWARCLPECQPYPGQVLKSVGVDLLLFIVFMLQHSLLAERNLTGTFIHRKVFIEWKINGALYTLTTAAALQILMNYWIVVPVYIWNIPKVQPVCVLLHVISWFSLYGTTLMQDMPELIGLHQVVFTNVSTSRKSSEFQAMLKTQRHLGFIPFAVLVAICPVMTLDRLLFLIVLVTYSYTMWRDPVSFEYIKEMTSKKRTRLSDVKDD